MCSSSSTKVQRRPRTFCQGTISRKTGTNWWWRSIWTRNTFNRWENASSHHIPWYRELPVLYTKSIHRWWSEELQRTTGLQPDVLWVDTGSSGQKIRWQVSGEMQDVYHVMYTSYVDLHILLVIQNAHILDALLLSVCLVVHY